MNILPLLPFLALTVSAPFSTDRAVLAMGTELRIHLEGPGITEKNSETALVEEARIEAACSTWDPGSAWSQLNKAQGRPVPMNVEWIALLSCMKTWSGQTEGAFDPVLGALVKTWGLRERNGASPLAAVLARARQAAGAELLNLDPAQGTAQLGDAEAGIEEGAFLKGYALDAMRRVGQAPVGWLNFGGQILAWGKPLTVTIADPLDRQRSRLILRIRDASLSCSGTSERGRHLLNPSTGRPCPAWGSTAVVAPEALTADVLSTALYVMGPDAGLRWADEHGVAVAFLLNDGGLRMSSAFRALKASNLQQVRP